ncbi:helix-turn-helix domain containing protein [Streptomyces sp. ME01-24h]|nr:helix-turn-helix domain containing protein [Streptomyces sp. ME19-03-3]MDX3357400.1 helix-turn-helix domain containing protein [Streptomyces sp. ME01-24h]
MERRRPTGAGSATAVDAPRAALRTEQRDLTRNRILDGAAGVFAATSFVAATMEDIARAAGVTRATVYAHFGGKAEVIAALTDRVYQATDALYAELAAVPEWTRADVRAWLEHAAARWRELAPTIRVLLAATPSAAGDGGSAHDHYLAAHERYVALLTAEPRRWRGVTPAQARQRALMAVLQTGSFLTAWIAGGLPVDTDDPLDLLVDDLCHLLRPALGGPRAAPRRRPRGPS